MLIKNIQIKRKIISTVILITTGGVFAGNSYAISTATIINKTAHYQIKPDHTYVFDSILKQKLNTAAATVLGQKVTYNFFPKSQSVSVNEAYAILPNGKKVNVTKDKIFVRPSQASHDSPGFTNSKTISVIFPTLTPGAITYIDWKITQKKADPFGFNATIAPNFDNPNKITKMIIDSPADMKFKWGQKGGFKVTSKQITNSKGQKTLHLEAVLKDSPQHYSDAHMVSEKDINSYFMITTNQSWADFGDIWWKFYEPKLKVTPTIQKLADKITSKIPKNAKDHDKAAAALLYNWVAGNIHYIAVYLSDASNYTPNAPDVILKRGYGDCKDFSTLLVVLLKAANIHANPVAINWSNQFAKYPVATPDSFNHAIVYIPKWHMFLNPTNTFAPFGSLSTTLTNKPALIIKPNSELLMTPKNNAAKNRGHFKSEVDLSDDGDLKGTEQDMYYGTASEPVRGMLIEQGGSELVQNQLQDINLIGFGDIKSSSPTNLIRPLSINAKWNAPHAIYMGGEIDLFLNPPYGIHFYNMSELDSFITYGVQYPIVVGASSYVWDQNFNFPKNYNLKYLPKNINIKNTAGSFSINWTQTNDYQINVKQRLVILHDIYDSKTYSDLHELLLRAIQSQQQMLVLDKEASRF